MNIAFDMVSAVHGGGFKTYNKNILKGLLIENDDNNYYVFINKGLNDFFISDLKNVHVISIPKIFSKMIFRHIWMQTMLPKYLIQNKIDVHFSPCNIMPIILKWCNIKKILVIHSNLPWLYPSVVPGGKIKLFLQKLFTNISIKIADTIIVDSKTAKKELIKIFPQINSKIKSIYLGVDSDAFSPKEDINIEYNIIDKIDIINEPYFLTISSAVRYHCLKELIIAYEKICEEYNDIPKYLFISKNLDSKYFYELKTIIDTSNYSQKMIFLQNIDSNQIPHLYKNSNLYIFSSYCEVFGFTNLEAMSCGVPVITSNKSALPEICGDAAIYFDPFDTDDIKNKIINICYNKRQKKEMIEKGYHQAKKYTWEKTFQQTKEVIFS